MSYILRRPGEGLLSFELLNSSVGYAIYENPFKCLLSTDDLWKVFCPSNRFFPSVGYPIYESPFKCLLSTDVL